MTDKVESPKGNVPMNEKLMKENQNYLLRKWALRWIVVVAVIFVLSSLIIFFSKLNDIQKSKFPRAVRKRIDQTMQSLEHTIERADVLQEEGNLKEAERVLEFANQDIQTLQRIIGGDTISQLSKISETMILHKIEKVKLAIQDQKQIESNLKQNLLNQQKQQEEQNVRKEPFTPLPNSLTSPTFEPILESSQIPSPTSLSQQKQELEAKFQYIVQKQKEQKKIKKNSSKSAVKKTPKEVLALIQESKKKV